MQTVQTSRLPPDTLLARYAKDGNFTDCYTADLPRPVTQAEYIEAFYLGPLMRIERRLIGWLMSQPTTAADVRRLAQSEAARFAAWTLEARTPTELLLQDLSGRTRSWLMTEPHATGTRLYFGSAVVPRVNRATGERRMGPLFKPMLGFHAWYSRHLLAAARARLARKTGM